MRLEGAVLRIRRIGAGLVAAAILAAGCAPLPQIAQDEREYRRVDFENQFLEFKRRCVQSGGRVFVLAGGNVDRDGIPARGDRYTCS